MRADGLHDTRVCQCLSCKTRSKRKKLLGFYRKTYRVMRKQHQQAVLDALVTGTGLVDVQRHGTDK